MSSPHQPGPYDPAGGPDAYSNPHGESPYGLPQQAQGQYQQPGQYGQPYQQDQYGQPQFQQEQYRQPGQYQQQDQYQQPGQYQQQDQYPQQYPQQGQFQQQTRPPRAPGEGIMGPFTLRDILIFAGALIVLIGSMLPIRHVHIDYTGTDISSWVWHWGAIETIIFLVIAPIAAGVLCLIHKLASGFPPRIGSFSTDQVISGVAIAGAVYNFLFFIAAPQDSYFGSIIILLGSLLVFVAASLTMIPAFASDFAGRRPVDAPPKARAVPHAQAKFGPANEQGHQYGQQDYAAQQGQYGASNAPQGQYGASNAQQGQYGASNAQQSQYGGPAGAHTAEPPASAQADQAGAFADIETSDEDRSGYRVADTSESASTTTPYIAGAGAAGAAGTAYVAHEHSAAGEASDSYAHPASTETPIVLGTPESGSRERTGAHAAVSGDEADGRAETTDGAAPEPAHEPADAEHADTSDGDTTAVGTDSADESTTGPAAEAAEPVHDSAGESTIGPAAEAAEPAHDPADESTNEPQSEGETPVGQPTESAATATTATATTAAATTAAAEEPAPAPQPFWFAVPEERPAFDESGQPVFAITPGTWFLALEDHGTSFTVRSEDGRVGVLHDVSGIQRG